MSTSIPEEVLKAYSAKDAVVTPLGTGLINETFLVEVSSSRRIVVQRLHPIFADGVNLDLERVALHLESVGVHTPHLVRTKKGHSSVTDDEKRLWRAITYVPGTATDVLRDEAHAFSAGQLVARFHRATSALDVAQLQKEPRDIHDTQVHVAGLQDALAQHRDHALFDDVNALAEPLLAQLASLPDVRHHDVRMCHGDLKVSNLLFDDEGHGLCLVDLDTIGPMRWVHEMGDALRSWCNPGGEDAATVQFNAAFFAAGIRGYFDDDGDKGAFISARERDDLVDGVATICFELAARFLADALNDSYFGWNDAKFDSRVAHNLHRGRGQYELGLDVMRQRDVLRDVVNQATGHLD